jgi:hypothetical protein
MKLLTSEAEIVPKLVERVRQIIDQTGLLTIDQSRMEVAVPETTAERAARADAVIDVIARDGSRTAVVIEVKSAGQPSIVRAAASQLWSIIRRRQDAYGIVAVPFASEESRRVCQEMDVGIIDLAGNCLLRFDGVYVSVEGKRNPYPATRPLVKPFGRRAMRGVRAMLCSPRDKWVPKRLANVAGISMGLAYNLLRRLAELELVDTPSFGRGRESTLTDPEKLLKAWARSYDYRMSTQRSYYSPDEVSANEERLAQACEREAIRYAFTLTSGAARLTSALRYTRVYAYVERNDEGIASSLGWKAVPSGANVVLLKPLDDGVFYRTTRERGVEVVCAPQLYVDLASYAGRGEEAAEAVLENALRKQWRAQS